MIIVFFFFFFSSRRRHTRFKCDWSSDVCSSDLAILAFTFWSRNMGCHGGDRWQRKMQRMEEKMGCAREQMERFGSYGFGKWGPAPSGNHAFDEYRSETLRRLEEEQREFRDFLDRLRFAKDKSEFDEFMAERRNRPQL